MIPLQDDNPTSRTPVLTVSLIAINALALLLHPRHACPRLLVSASAAQRRAGGGTAGGVAWGAHIGGFIAGMLLVGIFKRRNVHFFNPPHRRALVVEDSWPVQ